MSENVWQDIFRQVFEENQKLCARDPDAFELNSQYEGLEDIKVIKAGDLRVIGDRLEVGDPLCYINTECSLCLDKTIFQGTYPVYLAMLEHPVFGPRVLSAKLDLTGALPVRYELAMPLGHTILDRDKPGVFALFGVDTGLACVCSKETAIAFDLFLRDWHRKNPGKNHYDDYFEEVMRKFAAENPECQREDGTYLDWTVPGTEENVILFNSGFGDGAYSCYWGYDQEEKAACLIVRFIDRRAFNIPMPEVPKPKKYFLSGQDIKPLVESNLFAIATDRIMVDGCKVGYMHRGEPHDEEDSGWVFYEGSEDEAYLVDSSNMGVYHVNTIANYDSDIIPYLSAPVGAAFFRGRNGKLKPDNS